MTVWLTCRKDSHVPVRYQRKKSTAGKRPIMKKSWKVVSVKTLVSNQFSASFNTEKAILFVTWWQFFRSLKFLIFFQPSISFFFSQDFPHSVNLHHRGRRNKPRRFPSMLRWCSWNFDSDSVEEWEDRKKIHRPRLGSRRIQVQSAIILFFRWQ